MKITTLLISILMLGLTSCRQSGYDGSVSGKTPVTFEIISDDGTKATESSFDVGDVAGVYVYNAGGVALASNVPATFNGSIWEPNTPIYWNGESTLSFYVHYPYKENGGRFSIASNQSSSDAYNSSIYLWASKVNVTASKAPIKMRFKHLMSSFEVRFKAGAGISKQDLLSLITGVKLKGLSTSCDINKLSGTVGNVSDMRDIELNETGELVFRGYITPQLVDKGVEKWISVNTSKGEYDFDAPKINFGSSERIVANFSVSALSDGTLEFFFNGWDVMSADDEIVVSNAGGIVELDVNSSVDYRVEVTSGQDWIEVLQSKSTVNSKVRLNIKENKTGKYRDGVVSLRYANIDKQVTIAQYEPEVIYSNNGGDLKNVLTKAGLLDSKQLTITGYLNSDDIATLAALPYLKYLDIRATDIASIEGNGTDGSPQWVALTSIELPTSLNSIGSFAFYGCSSLTSIKIPDGVTEIRSCAFWGCSSLTSINIPDKVTKIGNGAFEYCSSLTSINIPNGVTEIKNAVFYRCSSLTSIKIPNKVTEIGWSAFKGCSSLTSINIPGGVTSIGDNAFDVCNSLTLVECSAINPPELGEKVFGGAQNIILQVPAQSINNYKNTGWSQYFTNIITL